MDLDILLGMLVGAWEPAKLILEILGGLVVVGLGVVAVTPSQADDAFVAKMNSIPVLGALILAVQKFSPIQKKPKQE